MKLRALPQDIIDWEKYIDTFNQVKTELFGGLGRREMYLWQWTYTAADLTKIAANNETFVDKKLVNTIKTLGVMWDVLIDDIADDMEIPQAKLLLPYALGEEKDYQKLEPKMRKYLEFADHVLEQVFKLARQLPGFERHKESLTQHYEKLKDNFRYSLAIRIDPNVIQLDNYIHILSHNMHMIINGIIDLMAADYHQPFNSDSKEHALFWCGQRMGRIGNSVTTYEYEIPRGDYTSEVVAFALNYGFIRAKDLVNNEKVLMTIKGCDLESLLWHLWEDYRNKLHLLSDELDGLNVREYINGLFQLRQLHQASRGKK